MPNIRIDDEVYQHLNEQGKTEDTFNDVLRRLLGFDSARKRLNELPKKDSGNSLSHTAGETEMIERLMEKHLPPHLSNPVHRRQLVKLIEYFLLAPDEWSVKDREIEAAKMAAKVEGVTRETIQDGGTRRLGLNMAGFRKRLEAIEADYRLGKAGDI